MAGSPPLPGVVFSSSNGGGGASNTGINSSRVNSRRISAVIDRLSVHVRNHLKTDAVEFLNLCLSLARGIDYGIANHDIPSRAEELPSLVKLGRLSVLSLPDAPGVDVEKVCQCQLKGDPHLLAAIMVLMISVKSACQSGWFSDRDSEELRNLVKEIANFFGSLSPFTAYPDSPSVISTIMSRFYPRMKMCHMFGFLEVKPGFDAYVTDFQILKNLKSSPGDKIRLFVVQTDNIETSSCLISPANVNFLLNGKGVERRTSLCMDTGPQIPTAVTHLLKYGSNLLQAVGEFNGNYIIAVAIVTEMPNLDCNALQDYEQHTPDTVDSDSEIIEGSSRISLNCPISFKRIKTPVKGHSCKHIQCFDFDNYVDINSRRPSWRCPHCNQHVCFTDIRIDQKMVKILKEVEPKVSNIIVSSDGSWNAAIDSGDAIQKPKEKTSETEQHESPQDLDLFDLTLTDDIMDDITTCATEDRKLTQNAGQPQNMSVNPLIANTDNVNQRGAHDDDGFWSGIYLSTFGQGLSNEGVSVAPPVITDSFTPNEGFEAFNGNNAHVTTSAETSLPNTMQLPQHQFGNTTITPEYGRFPSFPRNVTRTPVAVQALPAQISPSVQQRSRNVNNFIQSGLSAASQQMSSSTLPQYPGVQQNHPFRPFPSFRPPHQQNNVSLQASNQVPNQQITNLRVPGLMTTQPSMQMQTPISFSRPQSHVAVPQAPACTTNQRSNVGVASGSQPITRTDAYDPSQQHNWRPAGRMRGALSGQAYTDALNQFIIRPNQQAQAMRPIQAPNYPSAGPANLPEGSGILPY